MAGAAAVALAAGCTVAASAIATWHIYMHLSNYTQPTYQRYTVRIIFMIHVYGLTSFLSLVEPEEAIYFSSICGMYEAWVIYNFLSLCLAWVGGPGVVATSLQGQFLKPSWHLMTCCCDAIPLDGVFIRRCKQGVLQFVILKPLLVVITLMLYGSSMYEDGSFSTTNSYLYLTIIYTLSYTAALAALVLFYFACKNMLQPFRPLSKFLLIKSVIFLTYWQGVLIALLASAHFIKTSQDASDDQDIILCVEMLFAAIGHLYAFPYNVYTEANVNGQRNIYDSILHALNFSDVVHDTMHQFAPTYHEYVLYSDGSQDAPQQQHQVCTLGPTDQEMQVIPSSMGHKVSSIELGKKNIEVNTDRQSVARHVPPTYGQVSSHTGDRTSLSSSGTQQQGLSSLPKPPLGPNNRRFSDNDFNPWSLHPPDARRAALFQYDSVRVIPPTGGSASKNWGSPLDIAGEAVWSRRVSSAEEEATELTKLTDRRTSEHGVLMDTIDLKGENEEYSEGFIQK